MNFIVDTHVLVWRLVDPDRLSKKVRHIFADGSHEFYIPTVALLEVQYLTEIGRIEVDLDQVLTTLREDPTFQIIPYDESAMLQSLRLTTTRDPFDRMILAQALSRSTQILTRDQWMKETAPHLAVF